MKKQNMLSVVSVLLSCILIALSWCFTTTILTNHETLMLSECGTRELIFKTPNISSSVRNNSTTPLPALSSAERIRILNIWKTEQNVQPHDPSDKQLTLEQAAAVAKSWLLTLSKISVIPALADNAKIRASLCSNAPASSMLIADVSPELGTVRTDAELLPYFSYWTVRFQYEEVDATIIINAVTGEVWRCDILLPDSNLTADISMKKALTAFINQLSLTDGEFYERDRQHVYYNVKNGSLLALAETEWDANSQRLKLYITTS